MITFNGLIARTGKWGLRGLTKTAVLQFAPWNIRVNSIHPGQIAETGFFQSGGPAFAHAARTAIPMHRQGLPKECADLVLFLWHRIPADRLEIHGDRTLVARYFDLVPPD